MNKTITFDKESKEGLLDMFGVGVDGEGFIVEKANPKRRILASNGEPSKLTDLAAIKKGSLVFVKSDIVSVIDLADSLRD